MQEVHIMTAYVFIHFFALFGTTVSADTALTLLIPAVYWALFLCFCSCRGLCFLRLTDEIKLNEIATVSC